METFCKRVRLPDQAGAEAAGLRWLGAAVPEFVAEVVRCEGVELETRRVREVRPTAEAARRAGKLLRAVHEAGASAFGAAPEGWTGRNYIGRVEQACEPSQTWAPFYVEQRVLPFARAAGLAPAQRDAVERACEAIVARGGGAYGDGSGVSPARIHGDLWAGNLLFGEAGPVVIDPAAHGGHPHTDLGMLALFGAPYLDEIFTGYGAPADIGEWLPMHQLHPLAVHALTHGRSYHSELARAAERTLAALA